MVQRNGTSGGEDNFSYFTVSVFHDDSRGICCGLFQEIEELIGITVDVLDFEYQVVGGTSLEGGKVVYGAKRLKKPRVTYDNHYQELAPSVHQLEKMEQIAHDSYFTLKSTKWS